MGGSIEKLVDKNAQYKKCMYIGAYACKIN